MGREGVLVGKGLGGAGESGGGGKALCVVTKGTTPCATSLDHRSGATIMITLFESIC